MQPTLGKGSSTKDLIIQILSEEWPLSVKQIVERVNKKSNRSLTYQAVHKCVSQLLEDKIVGKSGSFFQLSKSWLEDVKSFGSRIAQQYKIGPNLLEKKPFLTLQFECFGDYGRSLVNDFTGFPNPEKKPSICCFYHTYTLITGTEKEFENLRKRLSHETHYSITSQDTFLDCYFNNILIKLGKHCKSGVSFYPAELFVQGDYIAQPFYPRELWEKIIKLYSSVKNAKDFDFKEIMDLYGAPYPMRMVIFEDRVLADFIREEVIKIMKSK